MQWLIAAMGGMVGRVFTLLFGMVSFHIAQRVAIVTAYIGMSAALFVTVSVAVRASVEALRTSMPGVLTPFTYFLPGNINNFIAAVVLIRVSYFLWKWTQANLAAYADIPNRGMLM